MSRTGSSRFTPAQAGWIALLVFAGWVLFLFAPSPPPQAEEKPVPQTEPSPSARKLESVGLADNPDWYGLPEYFAVWADRVKWSEARTWFAYWHAGAHTYSYYFEATQHASGTKFRSITSAELNERLREHFILTEEYDDLTARDFESILESPCHPFVFVSDIGFSIPLPRRDDPQRHRVLLKREAVPRLSIEVDQAQVTVPKRDQTERDINGQPLK